MAKNWWKKLVNATIKASIAENPAVTTASGWRINKEGDAVQDKQDDSGVKELRKSLAVLGGTATGITTAPLISAPAITHGLQVMVNPALAKTTAGAVAATGLDAAGLAGSVEGLKDTKDKIQRHEYKAKDIPITVLSGMGLLPGASVLTKPTNWIVAANTGKSVINTVDNTITIGKALINGKLKFGNPTKYIGIHQSNTPLTKVQFPFNRWDVITHNADPNGFWLTLADKPNTTGTMSSRPFASRWTATAEKPLIQTGEIKSLFGGKNSTRNAIVKYGRRNGADAFEFRGIKDNALPQTDVVMLTDRTNPTYKGEWSPNDYVSPMVKEISIQTQNPIMNKFVAPEWEGLEAPVVAENFGRIGYIKSIPWTARMGYTKPVNPSGLPKVPKATKFDKFLQKPLQEQNDIIKYWNGERFSNLQQLKNNPQQYKLFQNWINKQ